MDFDFSDEQRMLKDSVEQLITELAQLKVGAGSIFLQISSESRSSLPCGVTGWWSCRFWWVAL